MSIFANFRKLIAKKKSSRRSAPSEVQRSSSQDTQKETSANGMNSSNEASRIASQRPPSRASMISRVGRGTSLVTAPQPSVEVTQEAWDVRDGSRVLLVMEDLHLHSSGVFSNVYKGNLVQPTRLQIAIKKTWPSSSHRNDEMIFLAGMRRVNPKNIIKLLYKFTNKSRDEVLCESFVFMFMPDTLHSAIKSGLDMIDIKIYTWQLFNGLDFLAANHIAHRDIKPINILVNKETGELQIGDFGSAKVIRKSEKSTAYQVTRYYRPPELLLGARRYDWNIDVWSGGCVFGEMLKGHVFFCGKSARHQLKLIVDTFGPPSKEQLVAMRLSPDTQIVSSTTDTTRTTTNKFVSMLPGVPREAVDLLRRILVYSPRLRYSGKELLSDVFFDEVLSPECTRANGQLTCEILERQPDHVLRPYPFKKLLKENRDTAVPSYPSAGEDADLSASITSKSKSQSHTSGANSTTGSDNKR